jgi:hypothetical protein
MCMIWRLSNNAPFVRLFLEVIFKVCALIYLWKQMIWSQRSILLFNFLLLQGECSNGAFTLPMFYFIIEDVISVSMKLNSPVRLWNFCVYCLKIALSVCLVLGFDLSINSYVSFVKKWWNMKLKALLVLDETSFMFVRNVPR